MSGFLDRLATLSSAEQILEAVGVAYDPALIDVHRLHILKRFRDRLEAMPLPDRDEDAVRAACHAAMSAAYAEFARGAGGPKTFRVFRQAAQTFVPLSAVSR